MELDTRQKVLGGVAAVLLVAGGVLVVRAVMPSGGGDGPEMDERTRAGLRAAGSYGAPASGLPEQGSMSDEEYARELIRLREEADARAGAGVEPGSARDGGG